MSGTVGRIDRILKQASQFEKNHVRSGFYLENSNREDMGPEYCPKCVDVVIAREKHNGGPWMAYELDDSANHDNRCVCEECGVPLHGTFTTWGAKIELEHFEEYGFNIRRHDDCYSWSLCEAAFSKGTDYWKRLMAIAGCTTPATLEGEPS